MNKRANYNKKIILIMLLTIGLIIAPTITQTIAKENQTQTKNYETITIVQSFSKPTVQENNEYLTIKIKEAESQTNNPGDPQLPMYTKTIELAQKTKIQNIQTSISEIKTINLDKQVQPNLQILKIGDTQQDIKINMETYDSNQEYPTNWYTITKAAGINKNGEHVLFVFLKINPVKYKPLIGEIQYIENFEIQINCDIPEIPDDPPIIPTFDLLIISPENYTENLTRLIEHKNNMGIKTIHSNLSSIYESIEGRDKQEKIKYYIKHTYETFGIKYVLLVGDVQKLPIRTTYSNWFEPDSLSDLYYADFYNAEFEFCSWDANENNRFGELYYSPEHRWPPDILDVDDVDLCADVHIGRLACVNNEEVNTTVNKIITYEKETYNSSWFKKIILAGGDTFPPSKGAAFFHYEGEVTNTQVAKQLPDFEHIKLWASQRNLNAFTFNRAINQGAGFLSYAGHGFEHGWGTYKPNALNGKMGIFRHPLYYTPLVKYLKNQEKLPIIFFDACLTAKLDFNITDLEEYYPKVIQLITKFTRVEDDPNIFFPCFAWSFLKHQNGGAIATIGSTRTAYSMVSTDGPKAGAGLLDVEFFKAYGQKNLTFLGEILTEAQNSYIEIFGKDYFTLEEYILLGDPSLKVGGYPQ